eukprot:CAMPEP_0114450980 /NCGR_PEP_ID=MMETSP0104-20121206/745_1 /TAXON_ID=37642 ORGANISM="Paraphysomonas imperforata, Strain PA2" /NCGR_SAMPLE_ID=MMETSP0104 /ASSEMBLY_ACC=CAM_ASM_000202 /LENGTH=388 /DNA_ID=CAMNT_0001623149 /DNA_START=142 /DNA_END=1312 /DNA_ORIENTATION=-
MGGAGSVATGEVNLIDAACLQESFNRNRETLANLFFEADINNTEFSDEMVAGNMPLFHWLLEDIGDVRLQGIGDLNFLFHQSASPRGDTYCDLMDCPDSVSPIEVDTDQVDSIREEIGVSRCTKFALIAECLGLSDLNFFDTVSGVEFPFNNTAVALNVSNNQLNNAAFSASQLSQSRTLLQVNILHFSTPAAVQLTSPGPFYSEELRLDTPGIFAQCPQLLRLVLDGCGLMTTCNSYTSAGGEEGGVGMSLFVGLVKLTDLSLKENQFEDMSSLQGLEYFSKKSYSSETGASFPLTLRSLNISENPVCESTAQRKEVVTFITESVPSVTFIDGKSTVFSEGVAVVDKSSAAYKQLHPVVTDNDMITETMAQEFASALKGEKDNAVVS